MREIRTSGSEGGGDVQASLPTPIPGYAVTRHTVVSRRPRFSSCSEVGIW